MESFKVTHLNQFESKDSSLNLEKQESGKSKKPSKCSRLILGRNEK